MWYRFVFSDGIWVNLFSSNSVMLILFLQPELISISSVRLFGKCLFLLFKVLKEWINTFCSWLERYNSYYFTYLFLRISLLIFTTYIREFICIHIKGRNHLFKNNNSMNVWETYTPMKSLSQSRYKTFLSPQQNSSLPLQFIPLSTQP